MTHNIQYKTVTEIRDNFAEVVEYAQTGIPTIGSIRGKRAVAVVPVEVLDAYIQHEADELRSLIAERSQEETLPLLTELDHLVNGIQERTQ